VSPSGREVGQNPGMFTRNMVRVAVLLAACGGDDDDVTDADASPPVADAAVAAPDAAPDAAPACPFALPAANRARYVVVSHPFGADGTQANAYEVWDLSITGELSLGGATFEMGRASNGAIAFRPDGTIGVVAQGDGTLGVFRLDDTGQPTVVHAGYAGAFYADSVVFDPTDPDLVYVLDNQWANNGGGIYAVRLACDGSVASEQRILEAKLPSAIAFASPDRALLAAEQIGAGQPNFDAHLLDWSPSSPTVAASADAFADDDAIRASAAVTPDGLFFLVGDNSSFSKAPNRVGVLAVGDSSLVPIQVLEPIEDPFAIVASPFGTSAIVVSGFGDEIIELSYNPTSTPPFAIVGQLAALPLPGKAVMIERGDLTGLVLISENLGVHRVMFSADDATDLGATTRASGLDNIVGAVGVQP